MYLYARAPQCLPPGSARACTRGQARQKRGLVASQSYVEATSAVRGAHVDFGGVAGIRAPYALAHEAERPDLTYTVARWHPGRTCARIRARAHVHASTRAAERSSAPPQDRIVDA
jgi:hypothetical protein